MWGWVLRGKTWASRVKSSSSLSSMQVFLPSYSKVFCMLANGYKKVLKIAKWLPGCRANESASKTSAGSKWSCTKIYDEKVFLYYAFIIALIGSLSIILAFIAPILDWCLGSTSISFKMSVLYFMLRLQNSNLRPYFTYFSIRTPGMNPLVFSTIKTLDSEEMLAIWRR